MGAKIEEQASRPAIEEHLDSGYLDVDGLLDALALEVKLADSRLRKPTLELRECPPERRNVAITISGGGAAGAYSAGVLEILLDGLRKRGISVGMLVGTSSGAINSYGVFLEALGMSNPQFESDPHIKQPYSSYIASVWSYIARNSRASRWVVGRRSWLVGLFSRSQLSRRYKLALALAVIAAATVLQPNFLAYLALVASHMLPDGWILAGPSDLYAAMPYFFVSAIVAPLLLAVGLWALTRMVGRSLFRDVPLLDLLTNTGPNGDMKAPNRVARRGLAMDGARVLSLDIVDEWYRRRDELPDFIVATTDVSARRSCLFTLTRPEVYARLLRHDWMAVQFDGSAEDTREYRAEAKALLTSSNNLLQALVASSAVPGAFPSQRIGLYGPSSRSPVHHHFVDGGVLNNSPVHIAIDAGATHVISLEIRPLYEPGSMADDATGDEGYGAVQAALSTFTTVLDSATEEDIRHAASWNRFLTQRPGSMRPGKGTGDRQRRVVPVYRIAPSEPLVGTIEFDGHRRSGSPGLTLRDTVRRGVLDMRTASIWNATVRPQPRWHADEQ